MRGGGEGRGMMERDGELGWVAVKIKMMKVWLLYYFNLNEERMVICRIQSGLS